MREEVPFRDALPYWSSTTFEKDTKNAWILMFDGAYLLSYYKTNRYQSAAFGGSGLDHRSASSRLPALQKIFSV